jgi:hypothetical protein
MFAVITYEVTNQPRAQVDGFATAHQNPPGIPCRTNTSACNTERFPVFGASGALFFGLLTWVLLEALFRRATAEVPGTPATEAR